MEKLNLRCPRHLHHIIAEKVGRLTNSWTEHEFCEIRVNVGHSVVSGDLVEQIWPEMVARQLMGHIKMNRSFKREDYSKMQADADQRNEVAHNKVAHN